MAREVLFYLEGNVIVVMSVCGSIVWAAYGVFLGSL
jgi:cytochrome b subunit of formate dehydrogenase